MKRDAAVTDVLVGTVVAFGSVVVITIILSSVCLWTPLALTLAPLAGLTAALASRSPVGAAIAAPFGILTGTALFAALTVVPAWDAALLAPDSLAAYVVSALVALVAALAIARQPNYARLLATTAVAVLLLTAWLGTMTAAGTPNAQSGLTPAEVLRDAPAISANLSDEGLYLLYIDGLRRGEDYYLTVRDVLVTVNRLGRPAIDATSAAAYRLPTLTATLAALPNNGVSYIALFLALGSAATIAAYSLCRRFVVEPLALVGAAAVASFYAGYARGVSLLQSEPWAGGLVLVAVALTAAAVRASGRRKIALVVAAAAVALTAALFRELAIAVLLAGLATMLVDREMRLQRAWVPWALALVALGAVAAVHVSHVAEVVAALPAGAADTGAGTATAGLWFHPDGRQLYSSVRTVMWVWGLPWQIGALLVAASVAGVAIALRTPRPDRLLLAAVVIGGLAVIAVLRPPGANAQGLAPYYWSGVIMPTVLACMALAFAPVKGLGGTDIRTTEATVTPPDAPTAAQAAVDRAPEDAQAD